MTRALLILSCILLAGLAWSQPHVHGEAQLQVVADGERLQLSWQTPLDNLLGFERAPRNERERAVVQRMFDLLAQPQLLFVPSPEAGCTVVEQGFDSPILAALRSGDNETEPRAYGQGHTGHADLHAEFVFQCVQPQALRQVQVELFEVFPGLRRLEVRVVTPTRQRGLRLTRQNPRLTL